MSLRSATSICFNDTATSEIYTLSLHDALPISAAGAGAARGDRSRQPRHSAGRTAIFRALVRVSGPPGGDTDAAADRKSTRLNSSHANISYAVFCLKKKTKLLTYSQPNISSARI